MYLGAGAGRLAGRVGRQKEVKSFTKEMKLWGTLTRAEMVQRMKSSGEGLKQVFRVRQWLGS